MAARPASKRSQRRYFITGRPRVGEVHEAMPAGHPVSWAAITKGTVLEGTAYPPPPMTRAEPSIRNIRNEAG